MRVLVENVSKVRQTAWWHKQGLVKSPIAEKDIVDESFLRDALRGVR